MLTKQRGKNRWTILFVESVLVIVSVVLALALNNWNDRRIERQTADKALDNVIAEIEYNRSVITAAYDYNIPLIEQLEIEPMSGVSMRPATIQDYAWDVARASGAVASFDLETISTVAELHALQSDYKQQIAVATELLYEANLRGRNYFSSHDQHFFVNTMYDIAFHEKRLIDKYDIALEVLKTQNSSSPPQQ